MDLANHKVSNPGTTPAGTLFPTFFIGGFECASHRLSSGRRLDLLASTAHDEHVRKDYQRLHQHGIRVARDGIRWHLIEPTPYRYDFSSVLPMLRAARESQTVVIWDLCHYGWPNDLDIFSTEFIRRFSAMVTAFVRVLDGESELPLFVAPVNEISFFAWAGGESAYLNPFETTRPHELKAQLVLAAIEAIEASWSINPHTRIVHTDPLINVVHNLSRPKEFPVAEYYRQLMFQAWDMLAGRRRPELGGKEKYLDILGVNYYSNNQWMFGETSFHPERWLDVSDPQYRPLSDLLREVYERYRRPMFIAETGTESDFRAGWLRYVCREIGDALRLGVPIDGICLYPVVDFPGWGDDRHCESGLWGFADTNGHREIYAPLAEELATQQKALAELLAAIREDTLILSKPSRLPLTSGGVAQSHIPDDRQISI
jgi:beta-glucosidase/6-phospho-beta-glucosidase/beta-galactosidase